MLADLTLLNEQINFRKNSQKLSELKHFDQKIKRKRLSRAKLRKGRIKRVKTNLELLHKQIPKSVELESPPTSPPYSVFSDQDISIFTKNCFSKNTQAIGEMPIFSVEEQMMDENLGSLLFSFELDPQKKIFLKKRKSGSVKEKQGTWSVKYVENAKEISPVPMMDSPISSLSDMVKISENLQEKQVSSPRDFFKKKSCSFEKEFRDG
jgi:hypothetical protein